MELNEEERRQLKKIIDATGVIPPGLQQYQDKRKFKVQKTGPVLLVLQDEKNDKKNFELIAVRKKNGLIGEELEVPLSILSDLGKRSGYYPWITQIIDDKEQIFPLYHGEENVVFSPLFLLVQNKAYQKDKIDPYNVPNAGFLFVYNPTTKKNYLEAVSGSVVAVVAVIENLMERHNEPYSRKNHILNWLIHLTGKHSKNFVVQAFSMQKSLLTKHKAYVTSLEKKED